MPSFLLGIITIPLPNKIFTNISSLYLDSLSSIKNHSFMTKNIVDALLSGINSGNKSLEELFVKKKEFYSIYAWLLNLLNSLSQHSAGALNSYHSLILWEDNDFASLSKQFQQLIQSRSFKNFSSFTHLKSIIWLFIKSFLK